MATKKNENVVDVKGKGDVETLKVLQGQPKMPVMLPVTENMEAQMVVVNGCIFAIPRGVLVQVPQSVYNIVTDAQMRTLKAKADIKMTENRA